MRIPVEERIITGLFLCSDTPNELLRQLKGEWNEKTGLSLPEKSLMINESLISHVFPWTEELTEGIDHQKFCESFFIQPDLFIRLRPGYESTVKTKLLNQGLIFSEITASCLSLANASRIENIIELDKEAVIQDYASQQTGEFFRKFELRNGLRVIKGSRQRLKVWDCCAGSGGKSLMFYDLDPDIELTVSDIRESILVNLKKRFARAGVRNYKSFVTDLTSTHLHKELLSGKSRSTSFEFIVCDAPCTGSGTWSRTPEQLYFFNEKKIDQYSQLQKKIVSNIFPHLQRDGFLLYITCSVFRSENEEVVEFIKNNLQLELIAMKVLRGYHNKADTMFVSLFRKSS